MRLCTLRIGIHFLKDSGFRALGYLYDPIDCVKPAVATEPGKSSIFSLWIEEKGGSAGRGFWTLMSIRMNHPFHGGKSLPARQEDSKLQILSRKVVHFSGSRRGVETHKNSGMEMEKRCNSSSFGNEHAEPNLLHVKPALFRSGKSYGFMKPCAMARIRSQHP
uniref:Uncharacterized protein n=1 Tax=Cucumis sativus TaxID=3659 RepID=A0A0A0L231_CUCSA